MAFMNLIVSSSTRLSVQDNQLITSDQTRINFTDLQSILFENAHTDLSTSFIQKCVENNVTLIFTDQHHMPSATILPLNGHQNRLSVLHAQISATKRLNGRLWQKIIKQKLLNQAFVLKMLNNKAELSLSNYSKKVQEHDATHIEGYAAALYFKEAFGPTFNRRKDNTYNAALNYGYAIVRSCIARELALHGFEPAFGIFHQNQLNAFNLADDLIEPFRPLVDLTILEDNIFEGDELTPVMKRRLLKILSSDMIMSDSVQSVNNCIQLTVAQLESAFLNNKTSGISLPQLMPLQQHELI